MRLTAFLWVSLCLCLPAVGLAGGSAVLDSEGDAVDLSWQNDNVVRLALSGQPGYMLVRKGRLYTVSAQGGRTMVLDMSSMGPMMQGMGQQGGAGVKPGLDDVAAVEAMEPTGKTETIAGIEGEVYTVTWRDARGRTNTGDAVLSEAGPVVEMTRAFSSLVTATRAAGGRKDRDALAEALDRRGLGLLRFENKMRVREISSETPPPAQFELPAEPVDMSDMQRMHGR